jgi:vacuolar-type H+-ATPase catalytic subunit A/Vma1
MAATSWNVAHNLNNDVQIDIFSIGGVRMWAEIVKISPNNSTILFDEPTAGYAVVI